MSEPPQTGAPEAHQKPCVHSVRDPNYIRNLGVCSMESIHSFLVRPRVKDGEANLDPGTSVPTSGKLHDLLSEIYERSEKESDVDILFSSAPDGTQQNDVRDQLLAYVANATLDKARPIAERLHAATTFRSGTGLLFLMVGSQGTGKKLVISRFPADSGILAEQESGGLKVEFLERIFMKSSKLYKSAVFVGDVSEGAFWKGKVVDKQIQRTGHEASEYWIVTFLNAHFAVSSEMGTKRFADALRDAAKKSATNEIKQEIAAIATLVGGLRNTTGSIGSFLRNLNASDATMDAVKAALKKEHLFDERFAFSNSVFEKKLKYKMIELDNGARLLAEACEFDEVFEVTSIDGPDGSTSQRFTTEGEIVDQFLKPTAR